MGRQCGADEPTASARGSANPEPTGADRGVPPPSDNGRQALGWIDESTKALIPPVHLATTFIRDPDNQYRTGFSYGRPTNPTFVLPEALLTRLEGRAACLTFASGMAAATAVFLALRPGDHVVAPRVMYWGLRKWLKSSAGGSCRLFCRRQRCGRARSSGAAWPHEADLD